MTRELVLNQQIEDIIRETIEEAGVKVAATPSDMGTTLKSLLKG